MRCWHCNAENAAAKFCGESYSGRSTSWRSWQFRIRRRRPPPRVLGGEGSRSALRTRAAGKWSCASSAVQLRSVQAEEAWPFTARPASLASR
jgi:hypothetical protein